MTQFNLDLVFNMYNDDEVYQQNKHRFSDFTLSMFKRFHKSKKGLKSMPNKIKCTLFLDYMIKFYLLPKIIKSPPEIIAKQHDIDIYFVNKLMNIFAESSYHLGDRDKYVKTPILVLKNIYYILILSLMLNDYSYDYSVLSESMKLEEKEIFHYYKEIGCKLAELKKDKKGKLRCHVELEAPLKLNTEHNKYGKNK